MATEHCFYCIRGIFLVVLGGQPTPVSARAEPSKPACNRIELIGDMMKFDKCFSAQITLHSNSFKVELHTLYQ